MKRTNLILVAVAVLLFCGARQANADAITYTESGTATGSIGLTNFTNALVTITFAGDTSNVSEVSGLFSNPVGTATVTIGGIGTFAFTDSLYVFDNQPYSVAGISDSTLDDILDTISSSALSTYGLTTAIGPVTGLSLFNAGSTYGTTGGGLVFSASDANGNSSFPTSTFAATTAAVPEPSSLVLLGVAFAGLLMLRRGRLL
jgi:hypothetical protein